MTGQLASVVKCECGAVFSIVTKRRKCPNCREQIEIRDDFPYILKSTFYTPILTVFKYFPAAVSFFSECTPENGRKVAIFDLEGRCTLSVIWDDNHALYSYLKQMEMSSGGDFLAGCYKWIYQE